MLLLLGMIRCTWQGDGDDGENGTEGWPSHVNREHCYSSDEIDRI